MRIHRFDTFVTENVGVNSLSEKTLKREVSHIEKDEFVILTAWRASLSATHNLKRMRELQGRLETLNLGFVKMDGVGQEVEGESKEKSLLIINDRQDVDFLTIMLDLANEFDQDFIVHGKDGESDLISKDGESIEHFDKVKIGVAQFYSRVKAGAFHLTQSQEA